MTKINLAEIEARAEKATEGPWQWNDGYFHERLTSARGIIAGAWGNDSEDVEIIISEPDAEFIAHAREDVPALIAEIRDIREYADIYRKAFWEAVKRADLDYSDYLPEEAN